MNDGHKIEAQHRQGGQNVSLTAGFALCIFVSAFLLFQVQPMIGRYLLPWFGGTPAVWSTVMLFFQVLLTGGYAYANWLVRADRRREIVHLALVGLSVLLIAVLGLVWASPIMPGAGWKPGVSAVPVWDIFRLLAISVGLPYFLLASNSPLMQVWFGRVFPHRTAYRLYAVSNAGSLLGLLTYPFLVEPLLSLAGQGWQWSLAYLLFAALVVWGAVRSLRAKATGAGRGEPEPASLEAAPRPSAGSVVLWIVLAMTASILLLATTSRITQEVAVIPFLWVLPLAIYLLSFVVAFSGERWYSRQVYLVLFFGALLLYGWLKFAGVSPRIVVQIVGYSLVLFVACMVCHGELYRLRPHAGRLTFFYLMVSAGGALGGIVVTFVAPFVFRGYWEMPLGVVLAWILFGVVVFSEKGAREARWLFVANRSLVILAVIGSTVLAVTSIQVDLHGPLLAERNFYGVVRVTAGSSVAEAEDGVFLWHGATLHGMQYRDADRRDLPTTYYGNTSGIGLALLNYPREGRSLRVGVLGLGTGTLSAYGRPGDAFRFYEINPAVVRLAQGEGGYFSFLSDSSASVEIVPGDARLSLEAELRTGGPQSYDLLVWDVFSSDSIPVHLLDVEAFDLYSKHLQPKGLLAVHITNRYLDLVPVVWTLARHFDLHLALIDDHPSNEGEEPSLWVLLSRERGLVELPAIQSRARSMADYATDIRLWTDDYSNLLGILR